MSNRTKQTKKLFLYALITIYSIVSNILIYIDGSFAYFSDYFIPGGIHYYYNWISVIVQPWICPLFWIADTARLPEPHSSIGTSLCSGAASAFFWICIAAYSTRCFLRLCSPLITIFGGLAMIGSIQLAKDVWVIRKHHQSRHTQNVQQAASCNPCQPFSFDDSRSFNLNPVLDARPR